MSREHINIHPSFSFNGVPSDRDTLLEIGYSYIKEGGEFEQDIGNFLINWLSDEDELIVQTSGSTGTPKRIALKKFSMIQSAAATAQFLDLPPGTKALCCLSAKNIAGKMMLVRALVLGWDLMLIAPSSAPLAGMRKTFDFCAMVPMQLRNSLGQLEQIRKLIVGGAALPNDLEEQVRNASTDIYETYGMTETASHVALRPVSTRIVKELNLESGVFSAMPGIVFSQDQRGCLVIDAHRLTAEHLVTNDLVELISKTSFKWLGRWDNVINSGGVKIIAEELESKISKHLNNKVLLLGIADDTLGEKLVLVAEGEIVKNNLMELLRSIPDLHPYEIPKEIVALQKIPVTENGKVLRAKTKELVLEQINASN